MCVRAPLDLHTKTPNLLPKIPLIEDLTTGTMPAGSNIVVEYESSSQWYATSIAIAAGWIEQGGSVTYNALAQSPANIRVVLKRLGSDTAVRNFLRIRTMRNTGFDSRWHLLKINENFEVTIEQ